MAGCHRILAYLVWWLCFKETFLSGVGLQWPLPPQNERRPGSGCGHLAGPAAEEEHIGDGLGKVLQLLVFKSHYF